MNADYVGAFSFTVTFDMVKPTFPLSNTFFDIIPLIFAGTDVWLHSKEPHERSF